MYAKRQPANALRPALTWASAFSLAAVPSCAIAITAQGSEMPKKATAALVRMPAAQPSTLSRLCRFAPFPRLCRFAPFALFLGFSNHILNVNLSAMKSFAKMKPLAHAAHAPPCTRP